MNENETKVWECLMEAAREQFAQAEAIKRDRVALAKRISELFHVRGAMQGMVAETKGLVTIQMEADFAAVDGLIGVALDRQEVLRKRAEKARRNAAVRRQVYRDAGLTKTPYGWE